MTHARCGIWRTARALVAAVVDTEGQRFVLPVPRCDDARWDWLSRLQGEHGLDLEVVLPDSLGRADPIGRLVLIREMPLWLAPDSLVEGLRDATRLRGPAIAATLARLPDCKAWRFYLRRIISVSDPRQLALL